MMFPPSKGINTSWSNRELERNDLQIVAKHCQKLTGSFKPMNGGILKKNRQFVFVGIYIQIRATFPLKNALIGVFVGHSASPRCLWLAPVTAD